MRRFDVLALCALALAAAPGGAGARTLVLPLRTIGVSDTTAAVTGDLLAGELEQRGVELVPRTRSAGLPDGESACDDAECALAAAGEAQATQVVYGSLSKLGEKIIVRIRVARAGETAPYYVDQLTASTEEDLDAIARRAADGIAAGRPNAARATIETVMAEETLEPRRRASRSGVGLRAGFTFPVNDSYGGRDRLTSLRLAIRHETHDYFIESTPLLGFAWRGGDTLDWTVLDVFGARVHGLGDSAVYTGVGLGVHSVRIEVPTFIDYGYGSYWGTSDRAETTLTADLGAGLLAFRTYDLTLVVDLRYHYTFADLGGRGAHGLMLTFGTMR